MDSRGPAATMVVMAATAEAQVDGPGLEEAIREVAITAVITISPKRTVSCHTFAYWKKVGYTNTSVTTPCFC